MTTLQILLLAIGVVVVLLAAILHRFRLVTTPEANRKAPRRWFVIAALICFFAPPLLRWLGSS